MKVELVCWKCTCAKCGVSWVTRNHDLPKTCAKCKSIKWDSDSPLNPLIKIALPKPIENQTHWAVTSGSGSESGEPILIPVEDWRFTPDKPQYAEDGNVYRQQKLAPDFKKVRKVRVDEDDHESVVKIIG